MTGSIFETPDALIARTGQVIGASDWLTVDQATIDGFARATGDLQWIHIDPERCRRELGSPTVAHGYLVLSLIARFSYEAYSVKGISRAINYGSDKVRYLAPVHPGSELRGVFRLIKAERQGERIKVTNEVTVEMRGAERPALVAEVISLFYL